ncbi:MAG: phage tail protein [Deltaproteobacteria bacterium]|nr:phage tail protein [Deltaproteobacteria bacterium]MDQ3299613.1 phage tail protein [Myxococcota bacterium]
MVANNPGTRKDPLPVFCFKVELSLAGGGGGEAFFKSVSGLKYETEVVPVREGGANDTTFSLIGATKWSNIVLKQGFTGNSALLKWREEWLNGTMNRIKTGKIIQLDTALKEVAKWTFVRGWPAKWELSELDASKSELSIETLEIAHEGLKFG